MKRIIKTHGPAAFRQWSQNSRGTPDHCYDGMPGNIKRQLLVALRQEQGFICAYTGLRIGEHDSHVEHIKPQNKCIDGEDVEYRNLLACFPLDGGDKSAGYGAPVKAGWWDASLFVSPLDADCESRFRFSWSGRINPFPDSNAKAAKTIDVLGLNDSGLVELRRSAIRGFFGFGTSSELSKTQAQDVLTLIDRKDREGKLRALCFVLKPLLQGYVGGRQGRMR